MSIKSKLVHLRLIITILMFILWTLWLYLLVRFAPKLSSDNERYYKFVFIFNNFKIYLFKKLKNKIKIQIIINIKKIIISIN